MPAVAKPRGVAPLKDLYGIGEIPPLGHVPEKMHAWVIRKERHGPPDQSFQLEVVPTWTIGDDEVLVYVMAGGVLQVVDLAVEWCGPAAALLGDMVDERKRFFCALYSVVASVTR